MQQSWNRKDLTIVPLIPKNKSMDYPYIPKPIMTPNFRFICIGAAGSGKTNMIMNLITRFLTTPEGDSIFDEIYVFAPSVLQDRAFSALTQSENIKNIVYASDQLETDIIDEVLSTEDDKIKLI